MAPHPRPGRHDPRPPPHRRPLGPPTRRSHLQRRPAQARCRGLTTSSRFPVDGLSPCPSSCRPVVDGPHARRLLERTIAGSALTAAPTSILGGDTAEDWLPATLMSRPYRNTIVRTGSSPPATPIGAAGPNDLRGAVLPTGLRPRDGQTEQTTARGRECRTPVSVCLTSGPRVAPLPRRRA